jgi:hypothetical protein
MNWRHRAVPLLWLGMVGACSRTNHGPGVSSAPGIPSQPGLPSEAAAAGDAATAAGVGGDASLPTPAQLGGAPSQDLEIVDVAAGGDGALEATTNVFLEPTEELYVFDQAGAVAQRRFAFDSASLALMSFGADGENPSQPVLDLPVAAAARGDELVVLELTQDDALVAVSYDSQLEHASTPLALAGPGTSAHALGGSATQNVAVWSEGARLHGQLFSQQGKLGVPFDFGPRSSADHGTAARVIWNGQHFVVLWTRLDADGNTLLSWATLDDRGVPISARNLLSSAAAVRLEDAVALTDGRQAALLTLGSPAKNPMLVFVDAFGNVDRAAHVYSGATAAWSLASQGPGLLLAARSTSSQGVVRLLDANGDPKSRWLVVDDSAVDSNFEPRVAVFAVDQGYGAVVRLTDGSAAVIDVDVTQP